MIPPVVSSLPLSFVWQNIVGSVDVKFPIRLEGLAFAHGHFSRCVCTMYTATEGCWCSYEPELFPGLIYRMKNPKIVLLIFVSGKVVLTGAKVRCVGWQQLIAFGAQERNDTYQAFEKIYPVLKEYRK